MHQPTRHRGQNKKRTRLIRGHLDAGGLFLMNAKLYLNGFFNLAHICLRKNASAVEKP